MSISLTTLDRILFDGPFTKKRYHTITLTNHNLQPVLFKIKTSSPQHYSASPRVGKLDPRSTVNVRLIKFSVPKDSPMSPTDGTDKFLIMSTPIPWEERGVPVRESWQKYQHSMDMHFKKLTVGCNPCVDGPEPVSIMPLNKVDFQAIKGLRRRAEFVITNQTNEAVAFKVKTTHPETYGVRPNEGRIEPMGAQTIEVTSAAQPSGHGSHKFLILSAIIPEKQDLLPYDSFRMAGIFSSGPFFTQKLTINRKKETGEVIALTTRQPSKTSSSNATPLDISNAKSQLLLTGLSSSVPVPIPDEPKQSAPAKRQSWVGKALKKLLR